MEKPYRIEDEKDLADTRYRWQYRAGMNIMSGETQNHSCLPDYKLVTE